LLFNFAMGLAWLALPLTREKSLDKFYCAAYRRAWTRRTRSSER
jgi:hypothetical protein